VTTRRKAPPMEILKMEILKMEILKMEILKMEILKNLGFPKWRFY